MATSRKILVVSALALGCHLVSLAVHSAFASSIVEFVLIVLAAAACFQTANRASGFARRFWRLMGIAFALYSAGQVLATRSEEHTSELQSQSNLVCRLLLEKKNSNESERLPSPRRRLPAHTCHMLSK